MPLVGDPGGTSFIEADDVALNRVVDSTRRHDAVAHVSGNQVACTSNRTADGNTGCLLKEIDSVATVSYRCRAIDVRADVVALNCDAAEGLTIGTIDHDSVHAVAGDDIARRRSCTSDDRAGSIACHVNAVTLISKCRRTDSVQADDITSNDVIDTVDVDGTEAARISRDDVSR